MDKATSDYVPGVCNINTAEVASRHKSGVAGFTLGVGLIILLLVLQAAWWLNILVFPFLFVGVLGILQARTKFCVSYGASGRQNATEGHVGAVDVASEAAKKLDRERARKMKQRAASSAGMATLLVTLAAYIQQ